MAYYTALITACNSVTQPPAGVTGSAYNTNLTPDQKLTIINEWTVVGSAQPMIVPTYSIYNVIVPSEFSALTTANQQLVRDILSMGVVDGSPGTSVRSRLIAIFPNGSQSFSNLSNLAKQYDTPQVPWWQFSGYPERINGQDLVNAGLA